MAAANREQETVNREQELGFVILSLFCEGSCRLDGKILVNYTYEVIVPFWRSDVVVGNAAYPVPAKPSFADGMAAVPYSTFFFHSTIRKILVGGKMETTRSGSNSGQIRKISSKTRIHYGLASLGMAVVSGIYAVMLTIYYQDYLGLGAKWIALAMGIYAVWNAFNDPIFGQITDRTRSKWGRRIPYLRFTAPFFALTFSLVWFAPENAPDATQFAWMLVTMLLYDTTYTILGLVHGTLLPELSESDQERGKLSIVSSLFGLLGTLIGFLVPDFFRPKAGSMDVSLFSLQMSMIAVGVIAAALIILSSYKIKERNEFSLVDEPLDWWLAIKSTLTSKSFIVFVIANFMNTFMFSICMGAVYYVADYVMQAGVIPVLAALFIPLTIGVPLVQIVLKKMEPVVAFQAYLVVCGLSLIVLTFLPADLIPISIAIFGFGYSGVQVINYLLLGQVIDEDEVNTGVRREGSYYGANALVTKPAQSLAVTITAAALAAGQFVTRDSNAGIIFLDQPESALFAIRAVMGLIPGVTLLVAAAILMAFPLRGKRLAAVKAEILRMHAEKHEKLEAMEDQLAP
jgi:GPH family glycoside/pentoside/hexuronide:cation symporter